MSLTTVFDFVKLALDELRGKDLVNLNFLEINSSTLLTEVL